MTAKKPYKFYFILALLIWTTNTKGVSNYVAGQNNILQSASYNAVQGSNNFVTGNANGIFGSNNFMQGSANLIGQINSVTGTPDLNSNSNSNGVHGNKNSVAGSYNAVVGNQNNIDGNANGCFGDNNVVNGNGNLISSNSDFPVFDMSSSPSSAAAPPSSTNSIPSTANSGNIAAQSNFVIKFPDPPITIATPQPPVFNQMTNKIDSSTDQFNKAFDMSNINLNLKNSSAAPSNPQHVANTTPPSDLISIKKSTVNVSKDAKESIPQQIFSNDRIPKYNLKNLEAQSNHAPVNKSVPQSNSNPVQKSTETRESLPAQLVSKDIRFISFKNPQQQSLNIKNQKTGPSPPFQNTLAKPIVAKEPEKPQMLKKIKKIHRNLRVYYTIEQN